MFAFYAISELHYQMIKELNWFSAKRGIGQLDSLDLFQENAVSMICSIMLMTHLNLA